MSNDLTEMVTDYGINFPDGMTEEQFFAVGENLARFEHGFQWALGDWFNNIPWGDKKAACERVHLNYKTAERCGDVCRAWQIPRRRGILKFGHYQVLSVTDLTQAQRDELAERAAANKWSIKTLTIERDKVLGHWEEPVKVDKPDALAAFVDSELAGKVPPRYQKQVKKALAGAAEALAHDFETQVNEEVTRRVKEERARLKELEGKAKAEFDNAIKLKSGVKALMTPEEFKFVRSLLHPDKHGGDQRYAKAFQIFNRLAETMPKLKAVK